MKSNIVALLVALVTATFWVGCASMTKNNATMQMPEVADNLDGSLNSLIVQITQSMTEEVKKKVAVIEFSDIDGKVTQFGKYLSEELTTRLFMTRKFEVVERQLLNKILEEHKLSMAGLVDPTSAKELGKILGVDAIVSGTIADLGESIKVNSRIISTETGAVFAVAAATIAKDASVEKLIAQTGTPPKPERKGDKKVMEDFSKHDISEIRVYIGDLSVGETGPSAEGGIEITGIGGQVLLSAWGKDTKGKVIPLSPTWSTNLPEIISITPNVGPKVTVKSLKHTFTPIELYVEQDGLKRTFLVFIWK